MPLRANSAECRTLTPSNHSERFKAKKDAWIIQDMLVVTKDQKAVLGKDDFEAVNRIGNLLYGKAK